MPLAEASNALTAAGLVAKITYSIQSGGDGTVMQQDPAPSASAPKGSAVSIMVAVPGTVPNVVGMQLDAAQAALARYGYKAGNIGFVQGTPQGNVVATQPSANSPLDVGEPVNLFVTGTPPAR
jgi:beta-lactam-binding protein with PASTA domain